MEIRSFTYCNDVINDSNGYPLISGPLQILMPINIPANFSFSISFGVYDLNRNGHNRFEVEFIDADGNKIAYNDLNIPDFPNEIKKSKNPICIQINVGFRNIVLNKEGRYKTLIKYNGEKEFEYPIDVIVNKDVNNKKGMEKDEC